MRVAVVGLGGVGGYIAAKMAQAGIDVVGFARGEHLVRIQADGIKIVEDDASWSVKLDARSENDAFEGCFDFVLFCVKSYDLVASYEHICSHIDKHTTLLSFSNGVNNGDILREVSKSRVLDGCIYILSHIEEAGVIRKKGKVFAAIFGGDAEATRELASLFEKAGLRHKTPSDIETAIWKKYIFISAFATLTSYYNQTIGEIYEFHKEEARELLSEIAEFAKRKGIDIENEVEKSLDVVSKLPYDSSTSMYLDFKNQKRVELESLSGFVKMPLMQKFYEELKKRIER